MNNTSILTNNPNTASLGKLNLSSLNPSLPSNYVECQKVIRANLQKYSNKFSNNF